MSLEPKLFKLRKKLKDYKIQESAYKILMLQLKKSLAIKELAKVTWLKKML